ncbi:MAG: mandelate racemase/muconate lactonizing enzyme family protein [Bryobacteraceae bacterium]
MKLVSIDAWPLRLPRDLHAATGSAGSPTRLAAARGDYRWSAVYPCLYSVNFETAVVRVRTDSGLSGWGEAQAPLAPEVACDIIQLLLAPVLEGEAFDGTPDRIAALWDRMYSTMRVRGQTGGFMLDAISGVDIALWDLAGKMAGKPVASLLSDSPKRAVPAYISGLPNQGRRDQARAHLDQGFERFKLFYDTDYELFFRGLDEMPTDAKVAVDALWRLTTVTAVEFGHELDARNALWLEAPLPPEDLIEHGKLARAIRTPIALGESYRTRFEVAPFFREGAVGILQPDLGRCGITEGLRLAAAAREHNVPVVPHISIAFGPQIAAALHYAAAVPNCHLAEYNPQVLSIANRFLREPLQPGSGAYPVPSAPGLGISIDETALLRALG